MEMLNFDKLPSLLSNHCKLNGRQLSHLSLEKKFIRTTKTLSSKFFNFEDISTSQELLQEIFSIFKKAQFSSFNIHIDITKAYIIPLLALAPWPL
jgi:hypothetical protein